jgi:cytochrome c peroxidase
LQGLSLFRGKARCAHCHLTEGADAPLTDGQFHHLGISDEGIAGRTDALLAKLAKLSMPLGDAVLSEADLAGLGRFAVSRLPKDMAAFRTPSLRNVALTAPYMHDGSVPTLEAAVDQEIYYGSLNQGRPISLTAEERRQLIAFLKALAD